MSKGPHADKAVCANCGHMTTGNKCDHCKTGFFGGAANDQQFCQPCDSIFWMNPAGTSEYFHCLAPPWQY